MVTLLTYTHLYYVKVPSIRQFLLTNLVRSKDGYLKFRVALDILGASLNDVSSFPFKISDNRKFYGPALFIRGTRSSYVKPEDFPVINHFFPYSKIEDIDTGHWVMFENPSEFQKGKYVHNFMYVNDLLLMKFKLLLGFLPRSMYISE